ncbi:CCDC90 family protein [Methylobacterium currus]|uniref:CCDC90 family protein n=1 Tax=Methylobacterium currus TaxID=2051553 RepID=UPI001E336040|nr:CCDC90 family protein [Methylobacterium currus]UHC17005.1 CCDC90 family protein [Methylobacterium currus]
MTAVASDTRKSARAIRERAHLSAEQAEGLSEEFAESVQGGPPTRADLQSLEGSVKAEFAAVRAESTAFKVEIRSEFAAVRSETKTEFASVRQEMTTEFASARSDMKLLEQRMTIKLGAMLVAPVGILLAAIRYMPAR